MPELAFMLERMSIYLFDDELADGYSWLQQERDMTHADDLEGDGRRPEAIVNSWGGKVHEQPEPRQ